MESVALLNRLLRMPLFSHRVVRYGAGGLMTMLVNLGLIWVFIELLGMSATPLQRNMAHLLGVELALLFSFHIHSFWTWPESQKSYPRRLGEFHLVTLMTIAIRQVLFYLLDSYSAHWTLATLLPILVVVALNFIGYDRLVFSRRTADESRGQ